MPMRCERDILDAESAGAAWDKVRPIAVSSRCYHSTSPSFFLPFLSPSSSLMSGILIPVTRPIPFTALFRPQEFRRFLYILSPRGARVAIIALALLDGILIPLLSISKCLVCSTFTLFNLEPMPFTQNEIRFGCESVFQSGKTPAKPVRYSPPSQSSSLYPHFALSLLLYEPLCSGHMHSACVYGVGQDKIMQGQDVCLFWQA